MTEAQTPAPELAEEAVACIVGDFMQGIGFPHIQRLLHSYHAGGLQDGMVRQHLPKLVERLSAATRPAPASDREGLVAKLQARLDDFKHGRRNDGTWDVPVGSDELTAIIAILAQLPAGYATGVGDAWRRPTYAEWQQRRGMLADAVDWAVLEYDEFMKDDAFDSQRVLDRIIARLRQVRADITPDAGADRDH